MITDAVFEPIELTLDLDRVIEAFIRLQGKHDLTLDELLPAKFFARRTSFASLEDLVTAAGCSPERFMTEERMRLDGFIRRSTAFVDLNDLLKVATTDYFLEKTGLGPTIMEAKKRRGAQKKPDGHDYPGRI